MGSLNSSEKTSKINLSSINYANITIISDGYNGVYWNDQGSEGPAIAIDNNQVVHVVWNDGTSGIWGSDYEIFYANYSVSLGWSNVTAISDGYNGVYWNDGYSDNPEISVDSQNQVHVVWQDHTDGIWGIDMEIMYVMYNPLLGWSNVTVISDGYNGVYWNDGNSYEPSIVVDSNDNLHVIWEDFTEGIWGSDSEIMYVTRSQASGWSNISVISDGFLGNFWNDGDSSVPDLAIDSNDNLYAVWSDDTDGIWGSDREIMYSSRAISSGWANATVISDGFGGIYWNDDYSFNPSVASKNGKVYVAWEDDTNGIWGTDFEIMFTSYESATGWANITVVSDGQSGIYWNDQSSNNPDMVVDHNNVIHLIWQDDTNGIWGTDYEIMYLNYTVSNGWTDITVISDGYAGSYWNDGSSRYSSLCYGPDIVYVVWQDDTNGIWGTDSEIMFTQFNIPAFIMPLNPAIPFGNFFILISLITTFGIIILHIRRNVVKHEK